MMNPAHTPFGVIFRTEVIYNLRRVAPYVLALLFSGNALLWWGWGPAKTRGWATNSDFFIVQMLIVFSFMTLPFFVALMMGDPVVRDFRTGVDPLIFSKPISRAEYLLGKFSGNFFVLICCQACFVLTLFFLQWAGKEGMLVQPARALPYLKHFLFFTVATTLLMSAVCFAVGTLTRNVKIVYGFVTSVYVLYIGVQVSAKNLPVRWRVLFDPLLMNLGDALSRGKSAEQLNVLALSYSGDIILNRALVVLASFACLAFLYARFSTTERTKEISGRGGFTTIGLAAEAEHIGRGEVAREAETTFVETAARRKRPLPEVTTATEGVGAQLKQLWAALAVEFRLLAAERATVVLVPLAALLCVSGIASYEVAADVSYSAAYAARTSDSLLLFLFANAIFYAGESLHRDRELRIEPVLWAVPAPNYVLIVSKFAATLLLSFALMMLVALCSAALQVFKGHGPVDASVYFTTCVVILLPSAAFMIAASMALNVLLRDKYAAYVACLASGGALLYLYANGHTGLLYNFVLYQAWTPSDLFVRTDSLRNLLTQRAYVLALAALCLALAHLFHSRKSARGLLTGGRLNGAALAMLAVIVSGVLALVAAVFVR